MSSIPAFCQNCGAVFPSGFHFENVEQLTLSGNKSGPCPVCGEMGEIPDGVFTVTEDTIELISGPERTVEQLRRLAEVLRKAQGEGSDKEEIQREVSKIDPELSKLVDWLPESEAARYAMMTVLISFIGLLAKQGWSYLEYQEAQRRTEIIQQAIQEATECKSEEDIDERIEVIVGTEDASNSSDAEDQDSTEADQGEPFPNLE